MTSRAFLDTNILLYAIGFNPWEAAKQVVASELLDGAGCVLSLQVLHEFLYQATHPRRANRLLFDEAWQLVRAWRRFPIHESTFDTLDEASRIRKQTGYSIWDCLIVAAAQARGCEILYTEDMQDGRVIDRLRIVNPFR